MNKAEPNLDYLDDRLQVSLLRFPYNFITKREGYKVTFALIVLFAWAIVGSILAAAFTRAAGKC